MTEERTIFVYEVLCRVNGKRYVGITSHTPAKRWRAHVRDSLRGDVARALHVHAVHQAGEAGIFRPEGEVNWRTAMTIFTCHLVHSAPVDRGPGWYWWIKGEPYKLHGPFESEDSTLDDIRTKQGETVRILEG